VPDLLRDGAIDVLGRMPWSSNATLLVNLEADGEEMLCIYKPQKGERPLWDFPHGTLCHREVAAYEISDVLGWDIVPETVLRDGPAGLGSVQRFVEHDPDDHYFTLLEEHGDDFRRMAAFDIVINNTDRKGGHCLRASDGRIFGIDHGVSFHAQWKVRTVIWDFGGEPLLDDVAADLRCLGDKLHSGALDARLRPLLDRFELDALQTRVDALVQGGVLPEADETYHCYPWPLV
jgi:hypothetical protein